MDSSNIIEINDLVFSYEKNKKVINNLSLSIKRNKWTCILGHNGSGKSTLSKLIIGLLAPRTGEIVVDGTKLSEETVYDIRAKVGLVFQNPDNQFVGSTVRDDIAFGMENQQIPRDEMIRRIDTYISKVNMNDYLNQEPHLLSGGQKQRVAIAGALALDSKVLIFDESTSMLDPQGRDDIVGLINHLKDDGDKTIISITHDLHEACLADQLVIMKEGKVIATGNPQDILIDKELMLSAGLDVPLPVKLSERLMEEQIIDELYINTEDLVRALWKKQN
ncbi:energy-coupling factor transporter ATPase [Haloplasma contractile]|uniref:Energy-coupling factor transporter ATP-binding protein EcfA 1 n=1 Tax=Haloplasma contractile SSD-17B TaxID=1033810 RepID=U2EB78_9MOLU|nr:energy-coupling factor transporter ATPase [Haloplasma contractile]ERJ12358.1 Energy-coupling factor transporter ATP-binding protein EcfA 1 [Haloplasma contractile SSD-17B]